MKFLPLFLCLFLSYAVAQPAPTNPQQVTAIVANAASTGTTLNKLAKLTSIGAVILATTDTSAYGVVVGGAGTTGNAQIIIEGNAGCVFDGATTQGDWVVPSTTTGGDCHDSGSASTASPPTGAVAVVQSTNGGAGTYLVTQRVVSAPLSAGVSSATIKGAGGLTTSGTCTITSTGTCVVYTPGGFLNKFRNGTMDVAQRGATGTVTTGTTAYSLDGWQLSPTGATLSWARESAGNFAVSALRLSCAAGLTAVTLQQRIESFIAGQLRGVSNSSNIVTVQLTVFNNTGASITPQISTAYPTATDNFTSVTTDLAATNLQTIANSATGTLAYTLAVNNASDTGYQVQFLFGGALNSSSACTTGGGYIDITAADIRAAPGVATGLNANPPPPELRSIATELAFCQRYYQSFIAPATNSTISSAVATGSTSVDYLIPFPTMRVAPTATYPAASEMRVVIAGTPLTGSAVSTNSVAINFLDARITVSSVTSGQAGFGQLATSGDVLALSAEL